MDLHSLLEDGSLMLAVDPVLGGAVDRWLPLLPREAPEPGAATLTLASASAPPPPPPPGRRTLALGRVQAWVEPGQARLQSDAVEGTVDLAGLGAELRVRTPGGERAADERAAWDLFSACTLASAMLLGRMGRALVHAAAVAPAQGGAWLLVGDSHAGKTTTCANLLSGGWGFLSDDHVVLGRGRDGRVWAEGWPRPFHLDEGWEEGHTLRRRGATDPHTRWPGRWRRSAPLAGMLFPRVEAPHPTTLGPMAASDALARLVRQSPWLLADAGAAPGVLALLRDAALLPARSLRLGLDSYTSPSVLLAALAPLQP